MDAHWYLFDLTWTFIDIFWFGMDVHWFFIWLGMGFHWCCTNDTIMMHGAECAGRLNKRVNLRIITISMKFKCGSTIAENCLVWRYHGAIPIREDIDYIWEDTRSLSLRHIMYEKIPFYPRCFHPNTLKTAQFIPKTKHSLWKPIIVAQSPKSDHTEFGFCTGGTAELKHSRKPE